MPTLCGLRRRGYTPSSIFEFVKTAGISKAYSIVDIGLLEHCIREELNANAKRRIAVLEPLEVEITNYPEDKTEYFEISNNPTDENAGVREVAFTKHLFVEKQDFMEDAPNKFFRLKPGGEVRLMGSYIIRCDEIIKDENGNVIKLLCSADLETRNNVPSDGRKIKGTIHWVSKDNCEEATIKLYDYLFTVDNLNDIPEDKEFVDFINKDSLTVLSGCKLEKALGEAEKGERFQFVRNGYFVKDTKEENTYNRIVGLRDSWAKENKK